MIKVNLESTPEEVNKMWREVPEPDNSFVDVTINPIPKGWVIKQEGDLSHRQEGINPMSYGSANSYAAPTAIASIAVPSDEQTKIDYLNRRVKDIKSDKQRSMRNMFHLDGPSQPRYYKELIDAIKNDEYTINEKDAENADEHWAEFQNSECRWFDYSVFYGINFTKFPAGDYKSYNDALEELNNEVQKVRDIIAIMPAEEALKAVQDLETWKPSNAPTAQ